MTKLLAQLHNRKFRRVFLLVCLIVVASFVVAQSAQAGIGSWLLGKASQTLLEVLNTLITIILKFEGWVLVMLSRIMLGLMSYNGFVNAYAVKIGWTLVRDISNLFFVLIILALAIGTILHVESYNFKKLLPKVILMAILINFSRLICGLFIDFAQVIMMTFAVGFASIVGAGQLMDTLHISDIVTASRERLEGTNPTAVDDKGQPIPTTNLSVLISGLLAIILVLISILVVGVILAVVVMRIIMLWILVTLSPLAYIAAAFPQGQRYAQQWWTEFGKYVIIGPVLAFFLWLSFSVASMGIADPQVMGESGDKKNPLLETVKGLEEEEAGLDEQSDNDVFTGIGDVDNFLAFVLGIAMLMGGLMITQQLGVAGGGLAGSLSTAIRQKGLAAVSAPLRGARFAAWEGGKLAAKAPFQYGFRKLNEAIGEGRASALWNPAAMVRGWGERRKELYDSAKQAATAGGQEKWEEMFSGAVIPHRTMLNSSQEASFAKDFAFMDKEELAETAAKLDKGPDNAENRAKKRAIIRASAEQGYLDDLMNHPEARAKVQQQMISHYNQLEAKEKSGKISEKDAAELKSWRDPDEVSGISLKDQIMNKDGSPNKKGAWYGWHSLHYYLQDYIGKNADGSGNQDGLNTIADLENLGRKTNHAEYAGHATYRSKADGGSNEMEMETIYDQQFETEDQQGNKVTRTRKSGWSRMLTELAKWPGRAKMGLAPHSFLTYNNDGTYTMNEANREAAIKAFGGQGIKITEHSQDRDWAMLTGGTGDNANFTDETKSVADFDKENASDTNVINHAKALATVIAAAGPEHERIGAAIWQKIGGNAKKEAKFKVLGQEYTVKQFMETFHPEPKHEEGAEAGAAGAAEGAGAGAAAAPKPEVQPNVPVPRVSKTAEDNWSSMSRREKVDYQTNAAQEAKAQGKKLSYEEIEETAKQKAHEVHLNKMQPQQTMANRDYYVAQQAAQKKLDTDYGRLNPQAAIDRAPADFGAITESLTQAIKAGFDSRSINEGLSSLESVMRNVETSIGNLPAGGGADAAMSQFRGALNQLAAIKNRATSGATLDPGSTSTALWKINQTLKGIGQGIKGEKKGAGENPVPPENPAA